MEVALPDQTLAPLRSLLADVFSITDTRVLDAPDKAIEFRGQLTQSSDIAYRTLEPRFKDLGYTIVLQHDDGADVVQALHGMEAARPARLIINVLLLIATVITTLMAGAVIGGVVMHSPEIFLQRPMLLLEGFPFAFTLLLILGIHEMGHYTAGRYHHAAVTLPYFIPMPPFGALPLGTLGAFIQLRSPIPNRRALFDIGVAGPLAGLVIAVGAFAIGLSSSQAVSHGSGASLTLGRSIFTQFMIGVFQPGALEPGFGVRMNPVMLAGWLGLFVTVINLLPIGQLDGGHILYAVMGRRARWVGFATIGLLVVLGLQPGGTTWLVWAMLGLFFGVRHAPALDDITPLDPARRLLALVTLVIFVVIFVPVPFR